VELEIWPMPSEAEREAIVAALERLADPTDPGRDAWWEAGMRENLDAEQVDGLGLRPRG
jgi:hypothetical protein